MNKPAIKLAAIAGFPLVLAGCVTNPDYASMDAGFRTVSAKVAEATGRQSAWVQDRQQARMVRARVKELLARKTIDADTAVQIALLNNKGLQAAYADLGGAAAAVWQSTMLVNPIMAIGAGGLGTPEMEAFRAIEATVTANLLALLTRERNIAIADVRYRQAQLDAALATLQLAAETRRAWINAVSAWETVGQLNRAQVAADAASELAEKLGESGAMSKGAQAREHAFNAELAGQAAQARLAARLAKEELIRLMGLWGEDAKFEIPNRLPSLPKALAKRDTIEAEALRRRIDLQVAKLELEAVARSYKLTEATRLVTDLELMAGVETEREREDGKTKFETTGLAELEFAIPIFDSGKARMRQAELNYLRAANQLAEKSVNIRSEARSAYQAYRASYDIARHYRDSVVPLRTKIEEEAQLTYNGMITNTFELLADTRAKVNSVILSVNAKRQFWLADAGLQTAINGGGSGGASASTASPAGSEEAGAGH